MAVSAIGKNDNTNSGNISYLKSIAVGVLTGYSLKYILPVTLQEKDEHFNAALNGIKTKAKEAKLQEIEAIKQIKPKTKEADTFIKMHDSNKLSLSEIKKDNDVIKLIKKINAKSRNIKIQGRKALNGATKAIRPTGVFLVTGAVVGFAVALTCNILNIMATNKINADYED